MSKTVRYSLDLSSNADVLVADLARRMECSKSDVLRRSITLMKLCVEAAEAGKRIGVAAPGKPLETTWVIL